jgi:uncharacterized protein (TIGR00296 family)
LTPVDNELDAAAPASFSSSPSPFFVSISNGPTLRGCLGSLTPRPLTELHEWARKTAFADSRFRPLEASELPTSKLTVSLLHSHEPAASNDAWVVGEHGITIDFAAPDGAPLRATYLPYVAADAKWTTEETLKRLVRKAGFDGPFESIIPSLRLTRFRASVCSLSFVEYAAMRAGGGPAASAAAAGGARA